MMRTVLATNVLASGALGLSGGATPPALLLHEWRAGRFRLVISEYIEEELRKTLTQPYFKRRIRTEDPELFLILLTKIADTWQFATASPVLRPIRKMMRSSQQRSQPKRTISSLATSRCVDVYEPSKASRWSPQVNFSTSSPKNESPWVSQNP
jgi:hypothetical protein